jgi:AbrB family looped-hinge helix DNA binding protein
MVHSTLSNEVQLGAQGRLVIPAALRKALNLNKGDCLIARKVGDSLILERREAIESRLWEMFSEIPKEISLVNELITERNVAAQTENQT